MLSEREIQQLSKDIIESDAAIVRLAAARDGSAFARITLRNHNTSAMILAANQWAKNFSAKLNGEPESPKPSMLAATWQARLKNMQ